jgi:hypothetical protein
VEKTDSWMVMLGMGILVISLVGSALGGRPEGPPPPSQDNGGTFELKTVTQTLTGSGSENTDKDYNITVNFTNVATFSAELTWQDEAASRPGLTNQPDELGMTVASPAGETRSDKKTASAGDVKLDFSYPVTNKTAASKTSKAGMGPWTVSVNVGVCGDQTPLIPDPLGLRTVADTGNAFTLKVTYTYFEKVKVKGGS